MKLYLSFVFIFFSLITKAQLLNTTTSTTPADITVCGATKTFSVTINNPSPFTLSNVKVGVTMPTGVVYMPTSVINATDTHTIATSTPNFIIANLPTLTAVTVTFTVKVTCAVLPFLASGATIENKYKITYTGNGTNYTDNHTTVNYSVKQPNLSITTFTNQSYAGNIGDTYTRCITVTNGGVGELSEFTLTDAHGNGVVINSVSNGVWTPTAGLETVVLNATHFTAIGNGNGLFESGESIIICENVTVNNCTPIGVLSAIEAGWGCNGSVCQSSISSANVVFPNLAPNLVVTPTGGLNACLGNGFASTQQLKFKNTGVGQATNIVYDIFNSTGAGYWNGMKTKWDLSTITYTLNGGAATPIAVTSSSPLAASAACSGGVSSSGAFKITIPNMNPNDEIILYFNSESCCESYVNNGWRFKGTYESICTNTYTTVEDWGKVYNWYNSSLTTNNSPASVVSGQAGTFNALFQTAYLTDLSGMGNNKITIDYIVPACLTYVAGSAKIKDPNNIVSHSTPTVTIIGDTVRVEYSNNIQFYFDQFQALIDLQANCAMCAGGGNYNIQSILYYTPNNSCGCKVYLSTLNTPIEVVCPIVCEGLNLKAFKIERTSYGKADVNNDGIPEATAVVPTDVRVDRAMYGDTVTSTYNAVIKTSVAHPVWSNGYLKASITNGNNLTALGGVLKRYRAGVLITTVNILPVSATSAAGVFNYDISTLIATSINNDSLVFTPQYQVTTNIGGSVMQSATVTNDFYVSVIPTPTLTTDKFACNNFKGQFSIIGYYYDNYGPEGYTTKSCNNVTFTQNYYLSIGQCCGNYAGGNLFPNEYRQWATIDTLRVVMPVGYTFVSANFDHRATAGTLKPVRLSLPYSIVPLSTTTNVWSFYVGNYFIGGSPTIVPSDDGFHGTFNVTATPSCEAVGNVSVPIQYDWVFKPSVFLKQPVADNLIIRNGQDNVNYAKPNVTIQSILPNVLAYSTTVNWDVVLTNTTATDANNVWFTVPNTATVSVVKVEDITSGTTTLIPVGTMYQLGTLAGGAVKTYRITATYTSCTLDSIRASVGWNCGSYPTTLATAKCVNSSIKLQLSPQKPLLITNVINPPPLTNLCDTSEYVAEGSNIQLGSAYQLKLTAVLPVGVSIVPGTSYLAYPMSASYALVGEPIFIGGTSYQYNVSALNTTIGTNGMPGILKSDSNNLKIKFKVVTGCGYTSGSIVSFGYDAKSACGQGTGQIISLSSQLGINGATPPYLTSIKLITTYISPCNGNNNLTLKVTNQGPLSFGTPDSVRLVLPLGVSYLAGSSIFASNAPTTTEPRIVVLSGQQNLIWKLKNGVVAGDSVTINLQYTAQASALTCSIYTFTASSTSSSDLLCSSSGLTCGVIINTGNVALPVFTFKGYLALNSGTGYTTPLGPNNEVAHVSFTINNTGEQINASNNTIINFYNDANNNGMYDPADVLLTKDTVNALIPNGGSYMYNDSVTIPAGNCSIIARLDSSNNACSCNSDELLINLPLRQLAVDGIICSGNSINIGKTAITGYTYSWTPTTNLTGASISNPIVTGTNTTGVAETTTYYVQVNRGGCIGYDTCNVVVNWTPTANAGSNQNLCNVFTTTLAATAPMGGVATGVWSQLSGPNTATITTPTAYNSGVTGLIEGSYDFIWTVSNGTCTPAIDGITINVYNTPVATADADQDLCNLFTTTLAGNIPAGTATAVWTQTSGPNTATITTPTAYNTTLTGLVEGTYNFTWTVSNGTCTPATSAMIVKVYNSPIANAGTDQNLCGVFTTILAGNNPVGTSTGAWAQLTGATATITTPTAYNSMITGLAEGIYSFVWTVSNGTCTPVTDTVVVNVYNKPIATAGVDKDLCNGFLFFTNFAANTPTGTATAVWSELNGPNTALIAVATSPTSMLSGLVEGVYNFVWTISNGTCPASKDTIKVKVSQKATANAGADQDICNTTTTTFAGNAPVGTATGAWSQILGPNTAVITTPASYNSTVTGLIEGSYTFIWTLTNGICSPNSDAMIVRVNNTPIANAGSNQNLCNAFSTLLVGNANIGTSIGSWKQLNGPNTATIADTTKSNSALSGLVEGTYNFVWIVRNGACAPAKDTVTINVYNTPVANAGIDQQLCNTFTTTFTATIPAGTSTGVWSQLSGTTATITTPTAYNSTLTGLTEGTYKFIWKVSNGNCTPVTDTVTIKVYNTPLANAGINQQLCNTFNTTLGGNVPAGTSTGNWTQLSGPNASVITTPTLATSTITGLAEGTYNFVWTVSNGNCIAVTDTVAIKIYNTPTANAGVNQQLCATYITTLAATIPAGTATGVWSQLNGPTSSVIVTPSGYNSSITALGEGTYNFVWTVTNGNCAAVTDTVTLKVYDTPVAKAGANQNLCNSSSTSFTALAPAGTATGAWTQLGGPNTATIVLPTSKNASITGLVEGTYNFIWTVSNGSCIPATDTVTINVYNTPTANAGIDINVCNNSIATLGAVLPAGTSYGTWSRQSGPSAVVFGDTLLRTTNVSNLQEGVYKLVWTVSNGNCPTATDVVNVNVYNTPIANAGADIKACYVPLIPLNAQLPFGTSVGHWHDATTGGGSVTFVDSMQFNTSIKNLTPGFFDIVWVVENGSCPTATDTLHITNYKIPIVNFSFDEDLICQGDCINFTDLTQTFMNDPIIIWKWDDGLFGSASLPNPMFCYGDSGAFYPRLTVTTAHGCLVSKTSTDSIRVKGKPVAEFKVDNLSETDDLITINTTSSNFNVLKWEMGDGTYFEHVKNTNYDYTYADTGWYKIKLIAANKNNCTDTAIKKLYIKKRFTFYIPNSFSPNADYLNDIFTPKGSYFKNYQMTIYDRWGEIIFVSSDINKGWNGLLLDDSPATVGTYVYKVSVDKLTGKTMNYKGTVTLMK